MSMLLKQRQRMYRESVEWAKKELARCRKKGWTISDTNTHILAEVGRRWSIGAKVHVRQSLGIDWPQPNDEEDEPEFDEDGEEIE